MLPRFLARAIDAAAGTATLDADEAHHLSRVLRLRPGAELVVIDGRGAAYRATVRAVDRGGATLALVEPVAAAPEPRVRITLAQALLKADKMDDVVRDATMLGVTAITPVVTEHTIGRGNAGRDARAVERWQRVAVASAKQCGRAVVPAVAEVSTLGAFLEIADGTRIILVEPSAGADARSPATLQGSPPQASTVLVGPEGGWSAGEVARVVDAGWIPVSLGRRTLRADAVAVVALSVLLFAWDEF